MDQLVPPSPARVVPSPGPSRVQQHETRASRAGENRVDLGRICATALSDPVLVYRPIPSVPSAARRANCGHPPTCSFGTLAIPARWRGITSHQNEPGVRRASHSERRHRSTAHDARRLSAWLWAACSPRGEPLPTSAPARRALRRSAPCLPGLRRMMRSACVGCRRHRPDGRPQASVSSSPVGGAETPAAGSCRRR